jgi:hypothetical protein
MRAIETGYPRGHQAAILCATEYFCTIFRRESRCPQSETDQQLAALFWPRFLVGSPSRQNHRTAGIPPPEALNGWAPSPFALIAAFSSGVTDNISQHPEVANSTNAFHFTLPS